jgi:hypothetical protein
LQKGHIVISNEVVDKHLDAVLKASGSALRHYSMHKTIEAMRAAMREAMSISPHPIVTQPETNLPISGLGGYDQVLRDEFEDGKK